MAERYEERLAELMMGGSSNPLMTDGYKFSMAQAGFPMRRETFYSGCRKGGPLYIPFDLERVVRAFLPKRLPDGKERGFLDAHGYGMTPAMETALLGHVDIQCAPVGSWVLPKEPLFTVDGPSFLASWLEPLSIMLNFPLQIATAIKTGDTEAFQTYIPSCSDEERIANLIGELMTPANSGWTFLTENPDLYQSLVHERGLAVIEALGGDAHRAFEVGMRAATCMQQHRLALEALKGIGIFNTSNVYLAWQLYMIPVGTTGHEHQMRWSAVDNGDEAGFKAIRDMRREPPSYLFDTIDPMKVGIPTALKVMAEDPFRPCSMRFDSGDQDEQLTTLIIGCTSQNADGRDYFYLTPNTIFEDGYTAEKTTANEAYCEDLGWPRKRRLYGYGGYWVGMSEMNPFGRNNVSAIFKLAMTGGVAVRKRSGTPGKDSLPGQPVIWRRCIGNEKGTFSLIGQAGEPVPTGYSPLGTVGTYLYTNTTDATSEFSEGTKALMRDCAAQWAQATVEAEG